MKYKVIMQKGDEKTTYRTDDYMKAFEKFNDNCGSMWDTVEFYEGAKCIRKGEFWKEGNLRKGRVFTPEDQA